MALSPELNERCRTAFLACHEFESDDALAAVFVTTELSAFQDRLPRGASNIQNRVDRTLNHLLRLRVSGNRAVLPIFLAELASRYYAGDQLYDDLWNLYHVVIQELSEKVVLPFLIAAMTKDEASALFNEVVFNDPNIAPAKLAFFQEFQEELTRQGVENLQACYGEVREAWRPAYYKHSSVQQIIEEIFTYINEVQRKPLNKPIFIPEFVSTSFFSTDRTAREEAIHLLQDFGGVMVVDPISMFHPWLSQRVANANIGVHKHVAILVVSPVDAAALPINQRIEKLFDQNLERAYTRFHTEYDRLCEIDLGNVRSLKRWFFRVIPEAADSMNQHVPQPINRMRMRETRGDEQPRGIYRAFAGIGGV